MTALDGVVHERSHGGSRLERVSDQDSPGVGAHRVQELAGDGGLDEQSGVSRADFALVGEDRLARRWVPCRTAPIRRYPRRPTRTLSRARVMATNSVRLPCSRSSCSTSAHAPLAGAFA